MRLDSYPSYKQSGISWCEDIPLGWDVQPLYALANECSSSNKGMIEDNLLSLSYGKVINKDINSNDGLLPESFETYQVVEVDDIVLRLTDLQNDKRSLRSAIVKERGIITSAYLAIRPKKIDARFLNYLLRAYDLTKVFYSMGGGLRQSMKFSDVRRLPLILPSLLEQKSIATFLDHETAKIDTLVAAQVNLIALMKEKRQAVISHVVTKGLNLKVKMKYSGVERLGDIPDHWEIKPIQWVASINDEVLPESTDDDYEIEYVDIGSVNLTSGIESSEIHKFKDAPSRARRIVKNGDVIVSTVRTYLKAIAFVKEPPENMIVSTGFAVIRSKSGLESNFAKFGLQSTNFIDEVISRSTGISYPAINASELAKIKIPLPTVEEQKIICEYLNKQTLEIDTLISESQKIIVLSQERRSAVISAAVTGQIDVRNYQPKEVA